MKRLDSSFRDPSGHVFEDDGRIKRTITDHFAGQWAFAVESGFLQSAVDKKLLVPFRECEPVAGSWKTLEVERVPFISYPYEWCFSQLRDAALLTLKLNAAALKKGLVLKDATAYNAQFIGSSPIFIDLLSFEKRVEGEPWGAYRQFCMHFLAPLALVAHVDYRFGVMSKLWVDGFPLDLASKLLPRRTWLRFGLASHIHLHSRFENKYGDARKAQGKVKKIDMTRESLLNICDNLASTVQGLRLNRAATEWGDYYNDTNYTDEAADAKFAYVKEVAAARTGKPLAVDLGANTGRYSEALAEHFGTVLAVDVDPLAVEKHYRKLKEKGPKNILPLIMDLGNPSPGIGWACRERDSFAERCRADLITALALVHHLVVTAGIPLAMIAEHFAELLAPGGRLLLEFVPKEDSQTRRLLAVRKDIYDDYTAEGMRSAFSPYFTEIETRALPGSVRTLHLWEKRETANGKRHD